MKLRKLVVAMSAVLALLCSFPGNTAVMAAEMGRSVSSSIVTVSRADSRDGNKINPSDTALGKGFYKTSKGVVYYAGSYTEVAVPQGVTAVTSVTFAMSEYHKIKKLTIPSSVTVMDRLSVDCFSNLEVIVFEGAKTKLYEGTSDSVFDTWFYNSSKKLINFSAPKNSPAYKYAKRNNIPVVTSKDACFEKSERYMLKGDKETFAVMNHSGSNVKWSSSKTSVAKVNSKGQVTAKKPGNAVISAKVGSKTISYKLTVYSKTVNNRIKQIKKSMEISKLSKFNQIKAMHDWMIINVKYNYKNFQRRRFVSSDFTAEGALLKKLCVCDGYAKAFNLLMKSIGVKSKKVTGGQHAWNMVLFKGKWYHIDTTYDDPIINDSNENNIPRYTYFFKSSAYMKKNKHTFTASKFPKCTSTKYDNWKNI